MSKDPTSGKIEVPATATEDALGSLETNQITVMVRTNTRIERRDRKLTISTGKKPLDWDTLQQLLGCFRNGKQIFLVTADGRRVEGVLIDNVLLPCSTDPL